MSYPPPPPAARAGLAALVAAHPDFAGIEAAAGPLPWRRRTPGFAGLLQAIGQVRGTRDRIGVIDKGSPAGKAGLKVGDTITAFDGKPVESYKGLLQPLSETHIHDKVPIEVVRNGKHQTVTVEVEERPN